MAWRGNAIPIPGLISAFLTQAMEVYAFDAVNTLTKATFRLTDAGTGDVKIRLHNQADKGGQFLEVTISSGQLFGDVTGTVPVTTSLWQEIFASPGDPMNLSGEYEMITASGITQFFTTLAAVKQDANIDANDTDAPRDAVLNAMIAGVTRQMQDWMGRDILQGTATAEKIDGWNRDEIFTEHYPITGITTLTESDGALVENTDFESLGPDLPFGRIVRISGGDPAAWAKGRRNIVTTYDHGYVTVPESLQVAAIALIVQKYHETVQSGRGWRGLASKGVDPNAATTYDKDIWARETIPAMLPYRRRVA